MAPISAGKFRSEAVRSSFDAGASRHGQFRLPKSEAQAIHRDTVGEGQFDRGEQLQRLLLPACLHPNQGQGSFPGVQGAGRRQLGGTVGHRRSIGGDVSPSASIGPLAVTRAETDLASRRKRHRR